MIFKLLSALVVLSPLPFASVYPWSTSLLAILVGLLLIAWNIEQIIKKRPLSLGFQSIWPIVILFMFTVLLVVGQTVNYVPDELKAPLWAQASDALDMPLSGTVSINSEATITALMGLLTYAGVFWLSFQCCRKIENANFAMKSMALAGFVYACYGLWVTYTGSQTILWFDKFAYFDDLTSTFVNRNSYATYAGLGLVCTTGLFIRILSEPLTKPYSRSERVRQLLEEVLGRSWFYLVIWGVIMIALLLSHSRAGFLSTILALVVLGLILCFTKGIKKKYIFLVSGLSLFLVGILFSVSGGALDQRFGMLFSANSERPLVYQITIDRIWVQPWTGSGYGTFSEEFQSLQTTELTSLFLKAHNTYLEIAMEMGLLAAIPLFGVFASFLYLTYRGIRTRQHGVLYPSIGFSASVLVFLHSLVDFSLQIPAVAITYSFIIGAACAQSWSLTVRSDRW